MLELCPSFVIAVVVQNHHQNESKQPAISRDKFVNSQKFGAMPRYSYAPLATVSLRACDGSEGRIAPCDMP